MTCKLTVDWAAWIKSHGGMGRPIELAVNDMQVAALKEIRLALGASDASGAGADVAGLSGKFVSMTKLLADADHLTDAIAVFFDRRFNRGAAHPQHSAPRSPHDLAFIPRCAAQAQRASATQDDQRLHGGSIAPVCWVIR
jgi:hypothetical protein